jgi:phage terminase small subunit
MPNPRKPDLLKIMQGTYKKERAQNIIPLPVMREIPPMPGWMYGHDIAIAEWNKLTKILCEVGILTEAGANALAVLCMLLEHIVRYFESGECPPAVLVAQYRNMINDFGITPVAQTKVKANGEQKKQNSFVGSDDRPERLRKGGN